MKNIGSLDLEVQFKQLNLFKDLLKIIYLGLIIDIAGVSWSMKAGKNSFSKLHSPGATAFGVRLIDQFLKGKDKMQKTFSIIKPDATKRNITGSINKIIENNNLRISCSKKNSSLSQDQAKEFYQSS